MAVETKYVCDRCGHWQMNADQMWWVEFAVTLYGSSATTKPQREELWCRECAERLGTLPQTTSGTNLPPKDVTLDDAIREIVREEIGHSRPS